MLPLIPFQNEKIPSFFIIYLAIYLAWIINPFYYTVFIQIRVLKLSLILKMGDIKVCTIALDVPPIKKLIKNFFV